MEKRIITRSIIASPLRIATLVIILLLLIVSIYFWFFNQPEPQQEQFSTNQQKAVEQTVLPTIGTASDSAVINDAAIEPADSSDAQDNLVDKDDLVDEDDFASLPPVVTDRVATVGNSDDGQRVVVPSAVVDALVEGDDNVDTQVIDDAVIKIQQPSSVTLAEDKLEEEQSNSPLITFSFAKQQLLAVSDRRYTLQLAALRSMASTQNFITEYGLEKEVRIYSAYRSGVQWFIVTYRDFATIQAARNARAELPEKVQKLEPWVKSMLQVHREITSSN